MQYLNFSNVEELIFQNSKDIQPLLPPYYSNYFEQWKLGKQLPMLRQTSRLAMMDFLNHITENDIAKLEEFFGDRIVVEKFNYSTVQNLKIPLSQKDICNSLCQVVGYTYFSTWRDDEYLYISFWR